MDEWAGQRRDLMADRHGIDFVRLNAASVDERFDICHVPVLIGSADAGRPDPNQDDENQDCREDQQRTNSRPAPSGPSNPQL